MGFSGQEYWSGLPFSIPGDILDPGIEPRSPALQADSLPTDPIGNSLFTLSYQFQMYAKVISLYTHTYTYILFQILCHIGYYKILNVSVVVPCAVWQVHVCVTLTQEWLTSPPKGRASIYQHHWQKSNISVFSLLWKCFPVAVLGHVCHFCFK